MVPWPYMCMDAVGGWGGLAAKLLARGWRESLVSASEPARGSAASASLAYPWSKSLNLLSAGHGGQVHVAGFMGDRHED